MSEPDPINRSPETIFHQARGIADAAERAAFLARACGDDRAKRDLIEALLRSDAEAGSFLKGPATAAGELPEGVGQSIGRYKLLQQIGEGGFGTVFLAEQHEPVRRRVALKVIKAGMDSKLVAARFEAERQALALMDHPHIARVYDGGVTEPAMGSRPYFVMEYVVGDPITRFADAHRLSVQDRLELFTQVCEAVQHAHTKGIIHRDLKPTNVLVSMVDGRPFAKVIDFGIAKSLASRLTERTLFTEHRQLIGTPEYMSPEQAEGSPDIDTRTDVYALGVLLYELLTSLTPFDAQRLRSAAFAEMQRIIKEEDPPVPSLRLARNIDTLAATAAARGADPARLSTTLKGELDWIVMKALDKDRGRRYESANQLASDVKRHLAGEAVAAAPASAGYRLRKFVRRNRGLVAACATVVSAVSIGGLAAGVGFVVASRANQEKARQIAIAKTALGRLVATDSPHEGPGGVYMISDDQELVDPKTGISTSLGPTATEVSVDSEDRLFYMHRRMIGDKETFVRTFLSDGEVITRLAQRAEQLGLESNERRKEAEAANERLTQQLGIAQAAVGRMIAETLAGPEYADAKPHAIATGDTTTLPSGEKIEWHYRWKDSGDPAKGTFEVTGAPTEAAAGVAMVALADEAVKQLRANRELSESLRTQRNAARDALNRILVGSLGFPGRGIQKTVDEATGKDVTFEESLATLEETARSQIDKNRELNTELAAQADKAEWNAYTANIALAQTAIAASDYPQAAARRSLAPEGKRGWEWRLIDAMVDSTRLWLPIHEVEDWSPDGRFAVMRRSKWSRGVLDAATGRESALVLSGDACGSCSAEWAADSRTVFIEGIETTGFISRSADTRSWSQSAVLSGTGSLRGATFLGKSNWLLTLDESGRLSVWDTSRTGTISPSSTMSLGDAPPSTRIVGRRTPFVAIAGIARAEIELWTVTETGRLVLAGKLVHQEPASAIDISRDGSLVLTSSGLRVLVWRRGEDGSFSVQGQLADVRDDWALCASPKGHWIAGRSGSAACSIWDVQAGGLIEPKRLIGRWDAVLGCVSEFSPDESRLVAAQRGGIITVWDTATQARLDRWAVDLNAEPESETWPQVCEDGQTLIVQTGRDGAWKTWLGWLDRGRAEDRSIPGDPVGKLELEAIHEACAPMIGPALDIQTADGTRRVTVLDDRTVRFIDIPSGREVAAFPMPLPVSSLEMDAAGTRLLIGFSDGTTRVWDIRSDDQRKQDSRRRWGERAEASKYLDRLWAGETPLERLGAEVYSDPTLGSVRRLVAFELFRDRGYDLDSAAEKSLKEMATGLTDNADLVAKIRSSDLPRRVKERALQLAPDLVLKRPASEGGSPEPKLVSPRDRR